MKLDASLIFLAGKAGGWQHKLTPAFIQASKDV